MAAVRIGLPGGALVLLVGPAGSGKSTFARTHFGPTETISSDFCRALVADDENDQGATDAAFEILYLVVEHRLRRRRLTVVDATNVNPRDRGGLLDLSRRYRAPAVAIVFDLPAQLCVDRDAQRDGRTVGPAVVRRQWRAMRRSLPDLAAEGFAAVHVLDSPESVAAATIERSARGEGEASLAPTR